MPVKHHHLRINHQLYQAYHFPETLTDIPRHPLYEEYQLLTNFLIWGEYAIKTQE